MLPPRLEPDPMLPPRLEPDPMLPPDPSGPLPLDDPLLPPLDPLGPSDLPFAFPLRISAHTFFILIFGSFSTDLTNLFIASSYSLAALLPFPDTFCMFFSCVFAPIATRSMSLSLNSAGLIALFFPLPIMLKLLDSTRVCWSSKFPVFMLLRPLITCLGSSWPKYVSGGVLTSMSPFAIRSGSSPAKYSMFFLPSLLSFVFPSFAHASGLSAAFLAVPSMSSANPCAVLWLFSVASQSPLSVTSSVYLWYVRLPCDLSTRLLLNGWRHLLCCFPACLNTALFSSAVNPSIFNAMFLFFTGAVYLLDIFSIVIIDCARSVSIGLKPSMRSMNSMLDVTFCVSFGPAAKFMPLFSSYAPRGFMLTVSGMFGLSPGFMPCDPTVNKV